MSELVPSQRRYLHEGWKPECPRPRRGGGVFGLAAVVHEREEGDGNGGGAHGGERGYLQHVHLRAGIVEFKREKVDVQRHDGHPHEDVDDDQADPPLQARRVLRVADLLLRAVEMRGQNVGDLHWGTRALSCGNACLACLDTHFNVTSSRFF